MVNFARILIALELGEEDDSTLAFANRLLPLLPPARVDVVHVLDTRMVPDAILDKYSDWIQPARKRRGQRLEALVSANLELEDPSTIHRHILSGSPFHQISELSSQLRTSLIITGRSRQGSRVATLPVRLARRADSSVLVVPEGSRAKLQQLLVPVDFSEDSAQAVQVAAHLGDLALSHRLRGLHAYAIPPGARHSGKSDKELASLIRTYAERAFNRFREGLGELPMSLDTEIVLDLDPANAVLDSAQSGTCDFVVLNARDRNTTGHGLLGRVAARVLHTSPVPVLVVKHTG